MNTTSSTPEAAARRLWRNAAGIVIALVLPFVLWPSFWGKAFSTNFLAHRYCYLNDQKLVWLSVVSDSVIALSYLAISTTLAALVHRTKRDIPFSWVFVAFGLFIIACGGTHLMDAVTVWVPLYWLSADVKVVTALASLATAIAIPRLVPKAVSLIAAAKLAAERKVQLEEAHSRLLELSQGTTARLAAIVQCSEDAIIGCGLDGVITDWNPAATRLYGYSAEEAIGQSVAIIVPPNRTHETREILNTLGTGESIQHFETVRQRKDGTLLEVAFSISPITGRDGSVIGVSAIVHDITNRKRKEEALRQSEERFRLVARATKDAIMDWDMESGSIWLSDSFRAQFGSEKMESSLAAWRAVIHPEDHDRVWNSLQTALARHADSNESEYRIQRADGSYAIVLHRTYIVYRQSAEPVRAISAITDLSERRELEDQFRQAQKMEAVGRLAGGIAHDFNNLLMVISSYAYMIGEQLGAHDMLRSHLDQVLSAGEKAANLTRQLLAFSRKQVLSPRVIDLNSVIEDSLKMIRRLIGEDIELKVSLDKTLSPVRADPGQVVQVLLNLCVNARDAMKDGGDLTIETRNVSVDVEAANKRPGLVPGEYVSLVVRDTGTGFSKDVQAHLFEPFFTTKEAGKGTGLGLSTVYGIVKQSGGYIWADSELGKGTSFSLHLPAVNAPLTAPIATTLKAAEGRGESILLAEDDEALRESISTYLTQHGYHVLEAHDGSHALQIANQHAGVIQVLVTDVILPKMNGVELARAIGKTSPHVAILYMSGYTDRELMNYDPATSNAGYLQKPFALRILLERLQEILSSRR